MPGRAATEALPARLSTAVQQIRGAFTELFSAIATDVARPREAARRLGVNKNLTWKVSKIVGATNAAVLVQHLPGQAGLEILLEACGRSGAPAPLLDAVRAAVARFDELAEVHAGDRPTLMLMLNSMTFGDRAHAERREAAWKKAFEGNSVTFGVQARVRLATHFVAPNREAPDFVDSAMIAGLIDLRRLRPNAAWPLFRRAAYNDDGTPIEVDDEPIDARSSPELPLMREYSSKPTPEIRTVRIGTQTQYELAPGPIGRTGAVTCLIGHCSRRLASRYRDEVNRFGEHSTRLITPVEHEIMDLLVHNDLGLTLPPRAFLYSLLTAIGPYPRSGRDRKNLLQIPEDVQELGKSPPVVATPLIADYPRLVDTVYEHLGWSAEHFTGYRFVLRYPPIPTVSVLRYDLPERGD